MIDFVATFIFFFAVIDPIGTVPVFLTFTQVHEQKEKRKIALIAALASAAILLFFVIAGEIILTAMKIPLEAFQIAGGIVLFLFALTMIFGESKPEEETRMVKNYKDTALAHTLSIMKDREISALSSNLNKLTKTISGIK